MSPTRDHSGCLSFVFGIGPHSVGQPAPGGCETARRPEVFDGVGDGDGDGVNNGYGQASGAVPRPVMVVAVGVAYWTNVARGAAGSAASEGCAGRSGVKRVMAKKAARRHANGSRFRYPDSRHVKGRLERRRRENWELSAGGNLARTRTPKPRRAGD
jgi:hypothetical protein